NNVRSHRQYVDYTCAGSGVCTEAGTSWINDLPVEPCDYDCARSSTNAWCVVNPCQGVTCQDDCAGDTRLYGGIPTVMGDSCNCGYEFENCNDREPPTTYVEYCSTDGTEVRAYDLFQNFTCSGNGNCGGAWEHINDRPVTPCTFGCSLTSLVTAVCNPSPCEGHECRDDCSPGGIRKFNGVPMVVGDVCECSYMTMNCNGLDTDPTVTFSYCADDGMEMRAHDPFEDFTCEAGVCTSAPAFANDRHLDDCEWGCSAPPASSAICLACMPDWQCTEWTECDGPDEHARSCWDENHCGMPESRPAQVEPCECDLVSVEWEEETTIEGTDVYFVVTVQGTCAEDEFFSYAIFENDPIFDNPADDGAGAMRLDGESVIRVPWIAEYSRPYYGPDEYYVIVTLNDQKMASGDDLLVDGLAPCSDHPCEDLCSVDNPDALLVARPWITDHGLCACDHEEYDCNGLNEFGETVTVCGADGNVHERQRFMDYTCMENVCSAVSESWINDHVVDPECEFGCTTVDEHSATCSIDPCSPLVCAFGCHEHGECISCLSEWECSDWSSLDCSTPTRTRVCWDTNACDRESGRPTEVEPCPCNPDIFSWESTFVREGETAILNLASRGDCANICGTYTIHEVDWPIDVRWNDVEVFSDEVCLDSSGNAAVPWDVQYWDRQSQFTNIDPADYSWDQELSGYEYGASIRIDGNEWRTGEEALLTVGPHRDVLGDLGTILSDNTSIPEDPTVAGCFYGETEDPDAPIPPECFEWFADAGENLEFYLEEGINEVLLFVFGATVMEAVWTVACELCVGGAAAGVAAACAAPIEFGECPMAVSLSTTICGWGCMGLVERKMARAAQRLWPILLRNKLLARLIARYEIGGWRLVKEGGDAASASATYFDDATGEILDFSIRSASDGRIITRVTRNLLKNLPGGPEFLEFQRAAMDGAHHLITYDGSALNIAERRLVSRMAESGELQRVWYEDLPAIWNGGGVRSVLHQLSFEDYALILDDAGAPMIANGHGRSEWSDDLQDTHIEIALRKLIEDFGEEGAEYIAIHRTIRHEGGHAGISSRLSDMGYLLEGVPQGRYNKYAIEFFTDYHVYRQLPAARASTYREAWERKFVDAFYMHETGGVRNGLSYVERFVHDALDSTPGSPSWWLPYLRAMADESVLDLPALRRAIDDDFAEMLLTVPVDEALRIRTLFDDRGSQLLSEYEIVREHILDGATSPTFDDIVYRQGMVRTRLFGDGGSPITDWRDHDAEDDGLIHVDIPDDSTFSMEDRPQKNPPERLADDDDAGDDRGDDGETTPDTDLPLVPDDDQMGCDCSASGGNPAPFAFALLAFMRLRRRRR
ncbi:MAG: MYXO-CTERM sorting domain-containing protein, partial [Candidatus Uhrbacteria bacterium]